MQRRTIGTTGTLAVLVALVVVPVTEAHVTRLEVKRRELVLDGKSFGLAGAYEKLAGKAYFALDPSLPQNQAIVDLELARRNAEGKVEFSTDFYILKPVDLKKGNGRLLYEVPNRGRKRIIFYYFDAPGTLDPVTEDDFGDALLMRHGFSIVWMGWQWDVPAEREGLLQLYPPIATNRGEPLTGLVRSNIILSEPAERTSLGDRGHVPYPVLDLESEENRMTVRAHRLDEPEEIPRDRWHFPDPTTVALEGGFEPGKIYDVVYRAKDPKVQGTGVAATRDLISFFKNETGESNPLAGIRHALGLGLSQSGRFLRYFLYKGFNEDEEGRRAFDGLFIQVAGGGRGSFNHRFAQPSRDGYRHLNLLYPTDIFPFTDLPQTDSETGVTDGILVRAERTGTAPKIMQVQTSFEYWNRAGSLIHTDPEGKRDAEIPENVRIYAIASSQHIAGSMPPPHERGQAPNNPNDFRPLLRALLLGLDAWVADGVEPPESRYPRIADGTLTKPEAAGWPAIPEVPFPSVLNDAYRVDYGPEWESKGIVAYQPPRVGKAFGVRVPAVDADGNERAGVRLPEIEVPLGSQTGWNFRHPDTGAPDELAPVIGAYVPFPPTRAAREASGDPRLSVEERYRDRNDYLGRITVVALKLVRERYLLAEDLPTVIERAEAHHEWATLRRATAPVIR